MLGSSAWWSGIWRRSLQSMWLWRPVGLECKSSARLEETETPFLEGAHKVSCELQPRAKQWLHRSLGQTYLWVLEGLLGRQGLAVAHCSGKDTGSGGPREYFSAWVSLLPEVAILVLRPGPTQQPAGSSAWTPRTKQPTRWEYSPTHWQLPKVILSPQPPLDTPLDTALPTRGTRPSSTLPWAGTSPSHQEACTSPWTNLSQGLRQTPEARTTIWQPAERRPQTQKVRQNETAEKYIPDEGTR